MTLELIRGSGVKGINNEGNKDSQKLQTAGILFSMQLENKITIEKLVI